MDQKKISLVKLAMVDFGLDACMYNNTEYLCAYFENCISNDDVYCNFMRKLRTYS